MARYSYKQTLLHFTNASVFTRRLPRFRANVENANLEAGVEISIVISIFHEVQFASLPSLMPSMSG